MSARIYDLTTMAAVLAAVAAALVYDRSPALSAIALGLATAAAVTAIVAYFRRTSDICKHRTRNASGPEETMLDVAGHDHTVKGYFVSPFARGEMLYARAASRRGDQQALDFQELLASAFCTFYSSHLTIAEAQHPVRRESPYAVDWVIDVATRLYATEVGENIECELTRDGSLIIRKNPRKHRIPDSQDEQPSFESLFDSRWPHLTETKPI